MPEAKKKPGRRDQQISVLLTEEEMATVRRVSRRYGLSLSAAGRLLILAGSAQHDPKPSPPKENHDH